MQTIREAREYISEVVNNNPGIFSRETVEALEWCLGEGDIPEAERIVNNVLADNNICPLCLKETTANCNNGNCELEAELVRLNEGGAMFYKEDLNGNNEPEDE